MENSAPSLSAIPSPQDEGYFSLPVVETELRRVFDICHGCRRCFSLCPSFNTLFKRIDDNEGKPPPAPTAGAKSAVIADEVANLSRADMDRVVDECYQCKLCDNHCPYTPPHRFALDFPKLMLRAKATRVKVRGVPWLDRLLARVDLMGKANAPVAGIVNFVNRLPPFRWFLEKATGIDRRRNLPLFARKRFTKWFKENYFSWRPDPKPAYQGRVVLFHTCFVEYNDPSVGEAAVRVLEKNAVEIISPEQQCCGMPFVDAGDLEGVTRQVKANVDSLLPYAREGVPILALGPSCSYMLKHEYPYFLNTPESREVAAATKDICEYLMELHRAGKLRTDFTDWKGGPVAYHVPCHLKAQNIGYKSRDLLALLPQSTVRLVDKCSAHDGTWSMKKEWFDLSMKTAKKFFDEMSADNPEWTATDCPLAGLQLQKGTGQKALHPIQILARAYGVIDD